MAKIIGKKHSLSRGFENKVVFLKKGLIIFEGWGRR